MDDGKTHYYGDNCDHGHMSSESATYVRLPTEVRAKRWTGDNLEEINQFARMMQGVEYTDLVTLVDEETIEVFNFFHQRWSVIDLGDWLLYAEEGDFYPCRHERFCETYRPKEHM